MKLTSISILATFFLVGYASAQTAVWPKQYATTAGPNRHQSPFSADVARLTPNVRNMAIIAGNSLPFGPGSIINQIAFRPDETSSNNGYPNGNFRLTLARTNFTPTNVSHHFSGACSTNRVVVFDGKISLPSSIPTTGGTPHPFTLKIPFKTGWLYSGGNMVVDMFFGVPKTSLWVKSDWRVDAFDLAADRVNAKFTYLPGGCPGSNAKNPYSVNAYSYSAIPGQELQVKLQNATLPTTSLEKFSWNFLGFSDKSWNGLPLPFDLSIVGLGAGCGLLTGLEMFQMVPLQEQDPVNKTQIGRSLWPIPPEPLLIGLPVFTQWICNDSGVTSGIQLTVSNGRKMELGTPGRQYFANDVYLYGATGDTIERGAITAVESAAIIEFTGTFK